MTNKHPESFPKSAGISASSTVILMRTCATIEKDGRVALDRAFKGSHGSVLVKSQTRAGEDETQQ